MEGIYCGRYLVCYGRVDRSHMVVGHSCGGEFEEKK